MQDKLVISTATLNAIGQAIIDKGGSSTSMAPRDMPAAIRAIAATDPTITGKYFDLSTEAGVTAALAKVIAAFGGIVTAGSGADMKKNSPLKIKKNDNTYSADIYDDEGGIGFDITKDEEASSDSTEES